MTLGLCLHNFVFINAMVFLANFRLPLYKDLADGRDKSGYKQWFIWNKFPLEWPTLRKISGLDEDNFTIPWFFHFPKSLRIKWFKISPWLWRHQSLYTSILFQNWSILCLILTKRTSIILRERLNVNDMWFPRNSY